LPFSERSEEPGFLVASIFKIATEVSLQVGVIGRENTFDEQPEEVR
jgi:hypothetical protein